MAVLNGGDDVGVRYLWESDLRHLRGEVTTGERAGVDSQFCFDRPRNHMGIGLKEGIAVNIVGF